MRSGQNCLLPFYCDYSMEFKKNLNSINVNKFLGFACEGFVHLVYVKLTYFLIIINLKNRQWEWNMKRNKSSDLILHRLFEVKKSFLHLLIIKTLMIEVLVAGVATMYFL